ncbi:MAG: transporter related protein [Frankiales bacterium]|nr:transporter related protein [Frankiales bacterium]
MTDDVAIRVEAVSKKFDLHSDRRTNIKERFVRGRPKGSDEFWALKDVSFEVPRGSTYGLIGHNGSGKSTMLKLLASIHRPTSGAVMAAGRVSSMIELGAGFHPELSGRENVFLNGSILGMTRKQIDASLEEIIEFSGIPLQFIDAPVKVYSSGMYVRLGFAIAVNLDPEILLIDEIVAVGDEDFQRKCFDHLYKLRRKGVTICFVSHSLPLVQTLCDHALWLDHGQMRAEGKALTVVDEYLRAVNKTESDRLGHAEEIDDSHSRRGSREITISKLEFLDATGTPSPVGTTGEPLTVRMHYEVHQPVTEPVFGLAFHHESGTHVAGPNSREGSVMTGTPRGAGHVDFRMDRLLLQPGAFVVTAAVVDTTMAHVYDYRDQAFALHVQPGHGAAGAGVVDLPGTWTMKTVDQLDQGEAS